MGVGSEARGGGVVGLPHLLIRRVRELPLQLLAHRHLAHAGVLGEKRSYGRLEGCAWRLWVDGRGV